MQPSTLPMFVARAGQDANPGLNAAMDQFIAAALAANAPVTVVNHPAGEHGFDMLNDDDRSREIIRAVLAFFETHLRAHSPLCGITSEMKKSYAALAVLLIAAAWAGVSRAQSMAGPSTEAIDIAPDRGAAGMSRWLRQLQTRASLLMVTAHPDDEDGGMLTFETRGQGVRAGLLTLNRGEGGQNVMAMDFYDALGLTRTEELLAADRYLGVEQYFTRAIDYGFSKTREEALEKWDHERVLSDAVRVVRMVRPLVITSVFIGAPTDGHGNHQVAGQMAQEAFVAAGDPTKFPGTDSRRAAAVVASEGLCARSQLQCDAAGHVRFGHR